MTCDDFGADLIARTLGELPDAASVALDAHLAACATCRDAAAGFAPVLEGSRALGSPEPSEAALEALRDAVLRDEAVGTLLTAHALGQLEGAERTEAEALIAGDDALRVEFDAIRRVVADSRTLEVDAPSPRVLARVVEALREGRIGEADDDDAPLDPFRATPLPSRRNGRSGRILQVFVPLAVAAALLVAVFVVPGRHVDVADARSALVLSGLVQIRPASGSSPQDWADPTKGAVSFPVGDEAQASDGPVTLRVRCDGRDADSATASEHPADAVVDFELGPGARLLRNSEREFDLNAGGVRVHAGRFGATDAQRLVVRHGRSAVFVEGTVFDVAVVDGRFGVVVIEGSVVLRVTPEAGTPIERRIEAGRRALADGDGIVDGAADDGRGIAGFLTPRLTVEVSETRLARRAGLRLTAQLAVGDAGSVRIVPFEDSVPLFAVRLKGPGGERTVKLQDKMLKRRDPDVLPGRSYLLEEGRPYRLEFEVPGPELDLAPGRWTASVVYTSYRAHSGGQEWLGLLESEPAGFEVIE